MRKIRIATRRSKLALAQTEIIVKKLVEYFPDLDIEIIKVFTKGDREEKSQSLKRAFTEELERMILNNEVDIAIHSLKDLPAEISEDLEIISTPIRDDPRDVLISKNNLRLDSMKEPKIGTSSLRRTIQLRMIKSDIQIYPLRGNVDTRISKFMQLGLDGIVLAAAGLKRVGLDNLISEFFEVNEIVPAPGQGTIAIESLKENKEIKNLFSKINNKEIYIASMFEREFMKAIGGGCEVPCGAYAKLDGDKLHSYLFVSSFEGKFISKKEILLPYKEAIKKANKLAEELLNEVMK